MNAQPVMRSRTGSVWVGLVAALIIAACGDDSGGTTGGGVRYTAPDGQPGGACLEGNSCAAEGVFCQDGVCLAPSCATGSEGCGCFSNATCRQADNGAWLLCDGGTCVVPSCAPGALGCACREGGTCEAGLLCSGEDGAGRCEPPDCETGSLGCLCDTDRTCGAADGVALVCDGVLCQRPECTPGSNGCTCRADYGCDAGLACGSDLHCGTARCNAGDIGCRCFADGSCGDEGLSCDGTGICQADGCPPGSDGCGCQANFTCELPAGGGLLVCQSGICVDSQCSAGDEACGCTEMDTCNRLDLSCLEGLCVARTCELGEEDCPCLALGVCGDGLVCIDRLCVSEVGREGGACYPNGTCDGDARCEDDTCVACTLGTVACGCHANQTCAAGAQCLAGRCISETNLAELPPADPVCYSPCSDGIALADGRYVPCSADGLMQHCPESTECIEGSCVTEGGGPRTCVRALDCPDFQTCIAGQCYSQCEYDSECAGGRDCHRHVCRVPCLASGAACPAGQSCVTGDGEAGYCFDTPAPAGSGVDKPEGDFLVYPLVLELSNTRTRGAITVMNRSDRGLDFTLRKVRHTEYDSTGAVVETALPLFWLTLGLGETVIPGPDDPGVEADQAEALASIDPEPAAELTFFIEAGARRTVVVGDADNDEIPRWEGTIAVEQTLLGRQEVQLTYAGVPEGRWTGTAYYFGNFRDQNFDGPTGWLANRTSPSRAAATQNALVRRWVDFRSGAITLDEWLAVVSATSNGSWAYPSVQDVCRRSPTADVPGAGLVNGACYLYDNAQGFSVYSDNVSALAVPSGVVELPISMNLRSTGAGGGIVYEGRLNSEIALQYAAHPEVELIFANNPLTCTHGGAACLVDIAEFGADIAVGARYHTNAGDTACSAGAGGGYEVIDIPWLVPGFDGDTTFDPTSGQRFAHECRDTLLPFGADAADRNASLAGANPVPDGRPRIRHLELVDGVLINQELIFILFREWYEEFLGADSSGADEPPFSAYGMMLMTRDAADVADSDYVGNPVADPRVPGFVPGLDVACSDALVEQVLGLGAELSDAEAAADLAWGIITGMPEVPVADPLTWDPESTEDEQVHYYCEDTGAFDYGPGGIDNAIPCPPGSRVTYFTTRGLRQSQIDALSCQQSVAVTVVPSELETDRTGLVEVVNQQSTMVVAQRGTCQNVLNQWLAEGRYEVRPNPAWQCEDPDAPGFPLVEAAFCDGVRLDPEQAYDLRRGKLFYAEAVAEAVFPPIDAEIADAFRYRIRFRSRTGATVGFVPDQCIPNSDEIPYCYDPDAIESIRERVECAMALHTDWFDELGEETLEMLSTFLETNFSFVSAFDRCRQMGGSIADCSEVDPLVHYDGFERLYSELLIMLGDDAMTGALASRFDLAGTQLLRFQGSLFEPGGIDLSGGAGYEMALLYRAAQYYEMVLDRFYQLSPLLWDVGTPETDYITAETVTSYMERLVQASTKLTRAYNQIARRYQTFNRPELARGVIERGYTRAYLESIALARMMQRIIRVVDIAQVPQVQSVIADTQRRYRIALLDMADAYQSISNDVNYFGFPPDYIPFPGLRDGDINAVRVLLDRAFDAVTFAAGLEADALASSRGFDVDAAQFEAELVRVRNEYEDQLADVCGTFEGSDGNVYPAIPRYLPFFAGTRVHPTLPPMIENPCGLVGTGSLFAARTQVELAGLDLQGVLQTYDNTIAEIARIREETAERCSLTFEDAAWVAAAADRTIALEDEIRAAEQLGADARRLQERMLASIQGNAAAQASCFPSTTITASAQRIAASATFTPGACAGNRAAVGATEAAMALSSLTQSQAETRIANAERAITVIQRNMAFASSVSECNYAVVQANGQIQRSWLRLKEIEIQLLQQQYAAELARADVVAAQNLSRRLMAQQEESEQLLINVEAARNDPNVRIYQNAAVLRADRSFYDALRAVYRSTRVFEYYSSQSYARLDELFLVRMVSQGEINLEDYLLDLQNAFFDFEETFGVPATRVEVLSLRDDVLAVPRAAADSTALSTGDRIELMRESLRNVAWLDERGYLAIPFSTSVDDLSPLTRNHKILFIEAELIGSDLGDTVGRVYLRQRGTSTVRSVLGEKQFFAFPDVLAVLNPFFNGQRIFPPEVYRNGRLRDRPYANTHWELVLNLRDEPGNLDINLDSLTDIRIYVYYTDFTEL